MDPGTHSNCCIRFEKEKVCMTCVEDKTDGIYQCSQRGSYNNIFLMFTRWKKDVLTLIGVTLGNSVAESNTACTSNA